MDDDGDRSPIEILCDQVSQLRISVAEVQRNYVQIQQHLQPPVPIQPPAQARQPPLAPPPDPVQVEQPIPPAPEPRLPLPERFSGDRSKFRLFRSACHLHFSLLPRTYANEKVQVGAIISLLQGEPQAWALRMVEQQHPALTSTEALFAALAEIYDDPGAAASAESALQSLRQGRRPVEEYVSEFRQWAGDTLWNDAALKFQFRSGLSDSLKDELARVGVPGTLRELIQLSIQIDRRLRERRQERSQSFKPPPAFHLPPLPSSSALNDPEPMQIGLSRLSPTEKARRRNEGLCLYCGTAGHFAQQCPLKKKKSENFCA